MIALLNSTILTRHFIGALSCYSAFDISCSFFAMHSVFWLCLYRWLGSLFVILLILTSQLVIWSFSLCTMLFAPCPFCPQRATRNSQPAIPSLLLLLPLSNVLLYALCPLLHALCPMPCALSPIPYYNPLFMIYNPKSHILYPKSRGPPIRSSAR